MANEREIYCMNCFSLIPAQAAICPLCGESATRLSELDYREKLLHALEHPLDDVRMRAIIALGLRRDTGAALPLAGCALRHPLNIDEGIAVVAALKNLRAFPDGARAMEMLAENHAAHAVRTAAQQILEKERNDGR
ncbi:MAG: HEAT repeat domain-containing protein [Ferrovum myxofaciens]|uniref:hypothetical protein n=1 Tax=Ferrovum myxofaciens TaxID=416213 RepID=UPI002356E342|nr:hypothetical protein [Ferrovum myxofaciens]QKE41943.1 MAG: HEAT repeat domain-containing protein [Ferrovum myxofaciens]